MKCREYGPRDQNRTPLRLLAGALGGAIFDGTVACGNGSMMNAGMIRSRQKAAKIDSWEAIDRKTDSMLQRMDP